MSLKCNNLITGPGREVGRSPTYLFDELLVQTQGVVVLSPQPRAPQLSESIWGLFPLGRPRMACLPVHALRAPFWARFWGVMVSSLTAGGDRAHVYND